MVYGYISDKWPALYVRGDTLTREQTNEVIVRMTDPYRLMGNDKEWGRLTQEAFGITVEERYGDGNWQEHQRQCDRASHELGIVHTEYLGLHGRVYSAMIGGSHGWCNWDGRVESAYNVGKWPSVEQLTEQWTDVARAFPFLRLTAQTFDCEIITMDGSEVPCAQWTIANGVATLDPEPGPSLTVRDDDLNTTEGWDAWFSSGMRERHVSLERLQEAIAQVRRTYVPEDVSDDEHGE